MVIHVSQGMQRQMHVSTCMSMEKSIKGEGRKSVRRGGEQQKGKEGKKIKKKRDKKRRKGERKKGKRKFTFQRSKLVGPRSKVVYSTRATLQEVGILPTLVYFPP